jgi:ribonuclease P protein component
MRQTFTKDERLRKKILIAKLFQEGSSFYIRPFRVHWLVTQLPCTFPVQLLVCVPKPVIRHAVDRNKLKRRMREAYRKNKYLLYDFLGEGSGTMAIAITYTSKEIIAYEVLQEKIIVLLQRLTTEYAKIAG